MNKDNRLLEEAYKKVLLENQGFGRSTGSFLRAAEERKRIASLPDKSLEKVIDKFPASMVDYTVHGTISDKLMAALYNLYQDEMPYGTQTAEDGDPDQWITDRFDKDMKQLKAVQAAKREEFNKKDDWRNNSFMQNCMEESISNAVAKNEENPRAFELYLIKHCKTNLYWDGKGFNQKDKKKAILCEYRLMKTLVWEHKDVEYKIILADWRDDSSWAHLVPSNK